MYLERGRECYRSLCKERLPWLSFKCEREDSDGGNLPDTATGTALPGSLTVSTGRAGSELSLRAAGCSSVLSASCHCTVGRGALPSFGVGACWGSVGDCVTNRASPRSTRIREIR